MGNAYRWRWLLLAGVTALAGCAQLPGEAAYVHTGRDARYVAELYASFGPDPHIAAETQTLEAHWAKMPNTFDARRTRAVARAARAQPIIHAQVTGPAEVQQTASAPVGSGSGATTRRSLWDKQPWEMELDKIVRGICRGC
jgi:hypothetical protein